MMNPILVEIGSFQIHWYSALILCSFFLGYMILVSEARRFEFNMGFISNMFFWIVIFSLIGARAYYVFFNWEYYGEHTNEIIQVWNGGLAIHGGIIFGALCLIIYCRKYKVRVLRVTDFAVVGLALGQAIGRWGNFFNSEAYGPETTRAFLEKLHIPSFIIDGMNIYGTYFQPTFLYESLWMFIGFILLLIIRRNKYTKIGQLTGIYMMWYGIGRFFIEMLRQDSLMFDEIKVAQIVSLALFVVGAIIVAIASKGSKFENLYGEKDEKEIRF